MLSYQFLLPYTHGPTKYRGETRFVVNLHDDYYYYHILIIILIEIGFVRVAVVLVNVDAGVDVDYLIKEEYGKKSDDWMDRWLNECLLGQNVKLALLLA